VTPEGSWASWVEDGTLRLHAEGRWRRPLTFDARGPSGAMAETGRAVVAFASNDYLGLSVHPAVVAAAHDALDRWGAGSGASRLVTGSRPCHQELEEALAQWKGTERALLFPTGFAANLGVLGSFGGRDVRICSDELNHASIIDGARLSRAEVAVYQHRDVDHLEVLLKEAPGPTIVVTDVVFSMDGDVAPVADIVSVCRRHGSLLVLDEAHSVLGPHLSGAGASGGSAASGKGDGECDLSGIDVLRVGTLSKTLGSLGGFVAGPRAFVDLLENRARPYIFTTAPTPADAAAALAALEVLRSPEGRQLRERLARYVELVAPGHPSPIIPVILGTDEKAVAASAALLERGVWVPAIRPPTVAVGTARLRVTVSAAHTEAQIALLVDALSAVTAP
jgi:8-amino-7-oxononanoate synthase